MPSYFLSVLCSFIVLVPPNYKYLNLFYVLLGYATPLPTWHSISNLSSSSIPCSIPLTYDLSLMCFLPLMYGRPWGFTQMYKYSMWTPPFFSHSILYPSDSQQSSLSHAIHSRIGQHFYQMLRNIYWYNLSKTKSLIDLQWLKSQLQPHTPNTVFTSFKISNPNWKEIIGSHGRENS